VHGRCITRITTLSGTCKIFSDIKLTCRGTAITVRLYLAICKSPQASIRWVDISISEYGYTITSAAFCGKFCTIIFSRVIACSNISTMACSHSFIEIYFFLWNFSLMYVILVKHLVIRPICYIPYWSRGCWRIRCNFTTFRALWHFAIDRNAFITLLPHELCISAISIEIDRTAQDNPGQSRTIQENNPGHSRTVQDNLVYHRTVQDSSCPG